MEQPTVLGNFESNSHLVERVFRQEYGAPIGILRAPGRVNLIGEHTDYNDGFVMPAALDFSAYAAAGARPDRTISVLSLDLNESATFSLDDRSCGPTGHWSDYVRGVAAVMIKTGVPLKGTNLAIKSEVPIGAGLSSSAAIEVSTAFALLAVAGSGLARRKIALTCQRAEHEYAGTKCGIMDQFISCFGQAGHALLLDCRALTFEPLAVSNDIRIVICNTMVRHELAGGEYNARRVDCEEGVRFLKANLPDIRALRDVDITQLTRFGAGMPEQTYHRCRHVVTENARTLTAAQALRSGDMAVFGRLMVDSHRSLRDDYEVSCPELDLMVESALKQRGVFGARMTGGGFGGCTVNLVQAEAVDAFRTEVTREYETATGLSAAIYVCRAADGAGPVPREMA